MRKDASEIVQAVISAAKGGDMQGARIVLDRLFPVRRDNPVAFELPKIETASDASRAMAGILSAVASGELTPSEGASVAGLIETYIKAVETVEIERRLVELESKVNAPG